MAPSAAVTSNGVGGAKRRNLSPSSGDKNGTLEEHAALSSPNSTVVVVAVAFVSCTVTVGVLSAALCTHTNLVHASSMEHRFQPARGVRRAIDAEVEEPSSAEGPQSGARYRCFSSGPSAVPVKYT